jgi:glycosyltransferase EpsD
MKRKILFTASIAKHILRFHLPYLKWFQDNGYETHVACNGEEELPYTDVKHVIPFVRNPFHLGHFNVFYQLKKLIDKEDFVLVHCHTPMTSVVTRLAAKDARERGTKILYTAHGFHFYMGGSIFNWLIYYPIEMLLAKYADAIITINEEDFQLILNKETIKTKIFKIPGVGVNKERFFPVTSEQKAILRKKNGFTDKDFILAYAAEFIARKNHKFIVNSVKKITQEIPSIKILFAGRGVLKNSLEKKVKKLNLENQILFLGFREDIDEVYKLSDIGISSSKQEGLGLNLVEEMMCGLPIVASEDRGHKEIVTNGHNGFLYQQNNITKFIEAIKAFHFDKQLYEQCSIHAIEKAKKFELTNSIAEMEKIYKRYI